MTKMDQEFKARWVAALRSGEYKQGYGRMRTGNRFCCLGVVCDLVDPSRWEEGDRGRHLYADLSPHKLGWEGYPPKETAASVGLSLRHMQDLAKMNDREFSFEEIADYIEREL